jgi:hypothetical protein
MTHPLTSDVKFSIIPDWVLDAKISDRAVRIYGILARYADNETLVAFPKRETIASRAGCHVKSVDRAMQELVQIGAITKEHRKTGNGYQSNLYTLKRVGTQRSPSRGDTGVPSEGTQESLITRTNGTRPKELEAVFETFWSLYPRKVGKQAALRAFTKATKEANPNLILGGLDRFVNDPNLPPKQFLPHAATWLNEGRWEDEPYPNRKTGERPKPEAETPGKGTWKRFYHDDGDHTFCQPGDFDH